MSSSVSGVRSAEEKLEMMRTGRLLGVSITQAQSASKIHSKRVVEASSEPATVKPTPPTSDDEDLPVTPEGVIVPQAVTPPPRVVKPQASKSITQVSSTSKVVSTVVPSTSKQEKVSMKKSNGSALENVYAIDWNKARDLEKLSQLTRKGLSESSEALRTQGAIAAILGCIIAYKALGKTYEKKHKVDGKEVTEQRPDTAPHVVFSGVAQKVEKLFPELAVKTPHTYFDKEGKEVSTTRAKFYSLLETLDEKGIVRVLRVRGGSKVALPEDAPTRSEAANVNTPEEAFKAIFG